MPLLLHASMQAQGVCDRRLSADARITALAFKRALQSPARFPIIARRAERRSQRRRHTIGLVQSFGMPFPTSTSFVTLMRYRLRTTIDRTFFRRAATRLGSPNDTLCHVAENELMEG